MEIADIDTEYSSPKKRGMFDWTLNIGHVFIVFSLFLSAAGLYAHDEARMATVETKVQEISDQNLPPRMAAAETQIHAINDGLDKLTGRMDTMTGVLIEIRNSLDGAPARKHN